MVHKFKDDSQSITNGFEIQFEKINAKFNNNKLINMVVDLK